jgi:hypothetical protein
MDPDGVCGVSGRAGDRAVRYLYWGITNPQGSLVTAASPAGFDYGFTPVLYAYREEAARECRREEGERIVKVRLTVERERAGESGRREDDDQWRNLSNLQGRDPLTRVGGGGAV